MSGQFCSIEDCDTQAYCRGWCRKHYNRWLDHGDAEWQPPSDEERFWTFVDKTETCWLWTGATSKGYGRFSVGNRPIQAHRFAYELARGPIPEGRELDHRCTVRQCVRPSHLRITTHKQNMEHAAGIARISNRSSGVRGVTWDKHRELWVAAVMHHGKRHQAGRFDTIAEAEAAVIAKRNELFTHNDADRRSA